MDRVKINLDVCNRCKMCVDACFVDVFRWDDREGTPIAAYPEDCIWCYACEIGCAVQCIEVTPGIPRRFVEPY